jgi:predicted NBD/HSP70 family sugar kinase
VLDPELIVIGGGLGSHGEDVLLDVVRDQLETMTPLSPPPIRPSALKAEAIVLGALAIGLTTAREIVFNRAVATPSSAEGVPRAPAGVPGASSVSAFVRVAHRFGADDCEIAAAVGGPAAR